MSKKLKTWIHREFNNPEIYEEVWELLDLTEDGYDIETKDSGFTVVHAIRLLAEDEDLELPEDLTRVYPEVTRDEFMALIRAAFLMLINPEPYEMITNNAKT